MRAGAAGRPSIRLLARAGLLLALTLAVSGCWDRREIETLAFVMTLGIDRASDGRNYTVTASIALPRQLRGGGGEGGGGTAQAGGGAGTSRWLVTGTGETIFEAWRSIQESSSRRITGAHVQLIVIGEELCRQGVAPVEEFLDRDRDFRRTINLIVAEGPAQAILEATPQLEPLLALSFRGIKKWNRTVGTAWIATTRVERDMMASEGQELACGRIRLTSAKEVPRLADFPTPDEFPGGEEARGQQPPEEDRPREQKPGSGGSSGAAGGQAKVGAATPPAEEARKKPEILIAGGSVFKRDRLVGWMNRRETRGFLLIQNQPFIGPIVVRAGKDRRIRVSLETTHFRTRRRVLLRNGRPEAEVEVRWQGNVAEVMGNFNLTDTGKLAELERLTAEAIREDMRACLSRVQKDLKSDVIGIGASLRRAYPQEWQRLKQDWDRVYPEVPVTIRVRAKLRRVGVVTRPLKME